MLFNGLIQQNAHGCMFFNGLIQQNAHGCMLFNGLIQQNAQFAEFAIIFWLDIGRKATFLLALKSRCI